VEQGEGEALCTHESLMGDSGSVCVKLVLKPYWTKLVHVYLKNSRAGEARSSFTKCVRDNIGSKFVLHKAVSKAEGWGRPVLRWRLFT
jgi:hypothetical protein